jgi:hypothetical protein
MTSASCLLMGFNNVFITIRMTLGVLVKVINFYNYLILYRVNKHNLVVTLHLIKKLNNMLTKYIGSKSVIYKIYFIELIM